MATDNCAICLCALNAEVYVPCANDHRFHANCLLEWATTLHNCPICREEIKNIRVLRDGVEIKSVKPPKLIREKREELDTVPLNTPYDTMHCELCHQATDESRMLVCDACDLGFHMYCLNPPLWSVPRGLWECDSCRSTNEAFRPSENAVEERRQRVSRRRTREEAQTTREEGEIGDAGDGEYYSNRNRNPNVNRFDSEDEFILREDPNVPSTSRQPTVTMNELKKKKRKSKKTKRTKKKSKRTSDGKSPTKRKSKRKSSKREKSNGSNRLHRETDEAGSAHRRIAEACGLDLKRSDRYKIIQRPVGRSAGGSSVSAAAIAAGPGRLDLLGRNWNLPVSDEDENIKTKYVTEQEEKLPIVGHRKFTLSLLDEILANQQKVLAPTQLLKINRDGTIHETDRYREYIDKKEKKSELKSRSSTAAPSQLQSAELRPDGKKLSKKEKPEITHQKSSEFGPLPSVFVTTNVTSSNTTSVAMKPPIVAANPLTTATTPPIAATKHLRSVDPKSNKPMLIVKPKVENEHDIVKSAGCLATYSSASTSTPSPQKSFADGSTSSGRRRNRPSRWQPATVSVQDDVKAAGSSGAGGSGFSSRILTMPKLSASNGQPNLGPTDSTNGLPFPFSVMDGFKGVDPTALTADNSLLPTFPPGSSASLLDLILSSQQNLSTTNQLLQPSPVGYNPTAINGQLPPVFGSNLQNDPNVAAILQRFLAPPTCGASNLSLNLNLQSSALPATSSTSTNPISAYLNNGIPSTSTAPSAPSFALQPKNGLNNVNGMNGLNGAMPMNFLFNGVQLTDLININATPSSAASSAAGPNLLSHACLPNFPPTSLAAMSNGLAGLVSNMNLPNLNNLPPLNNNIALMSHFLSQQSQLKPPRPNFVGRTNQIGPAGHLASFVHGLPAMNGAGKQLDDVPPPPSYDNAHHLSQPQTNSGMGSPMDIEDDEDKDQPTSSSHRPAAGDKKHALSSPTMAPRKDRSETTRIADAAMKTALKPYFTKRMVSKEEYKEIMKKGVAKLRDKDELKPGKVEKFVRRYVELIAKRRTK